MATKNGNEPIDHVPYNQCTPRSMGLTKREWFAGLAMQGLLGLYEVGDNADAMVKSARAAADALLDELETTK